MAYSGFAHAFSVESCIALLDPVSLSHFVFESRVSRCYSVAV